MGGGKKILVYLMIGTVGVRLYPAVAAKLKKCYPHAPKLALAHVAYGLSRGCVQNFTPPPTKRR